MIMAPDHISLKIESGEIFGLVGESGSGKSLTALSIMGLIPRPQGKIVSGKIILDGKELTNMQEKDLERIRGKEMSMIFQDPLTSLDPLFKVGDQILETIRTHENVSKEEARKQVETLLAKVGISDAKIRSKQYPFELSGGMRQRIMIALAICTNPKLLIADEPTTNLDVTIQAQVLELIKSIRARTGAAILLITHNMGIAAWLCDKIGIMYAGQIVEWGPTRDIFKNPSHPYTEDLLRAVPKAGPTRERLYSIPGDVPDLSHLPTGCRYHPRCVNMKSICQTREPIVTDLSSGTKFVRCLMHEMPGWKKRCTTQ
jgi:peptide/nickel transport system ATP-binding protein